MSNRRWLGVIVLVAALIFLWWGWFVLGFLGEPSAVGRLRAALLITGLGSIGAGLTGGVAGVWMLVLRRT